MGDSFKKEVNPMLEKLNAQLDERTEEIIAKQVASFDEKLNAPDGLLARAKKIDEQCAEGKKASILRLEELLYQAQNADKLTVAEMLEKNPDWREAIEEDIKNHNWSPEAPASIIAALDAKMELEPIPHLIVHRQLAWSSHIRAASHSSHSARF